MRNSLSLVSLVLALLLPGLARSATPPPARTENYAWHQVVIQGGGWVTGLAFHPREPNLLYARTDVGGAFRWDQKDSRWIALNDAIDRPDSDLLGVLSLALDPQDPDRLYLATGSYREWFGRTAAILASSDRGVTWTQTDLPLKLSGNQDGRSMGERLVVDPHDGSRLLLGTTGDGLWRSDDRAHTWQRVDKFPAARLTFVLFDPASGPAGRPTPVIYAGGSDPGGPALFRSSDGGATWSTVSGQPTGLQIHHAALDANGTLYLTYANGPGPNDVTAGAVWKFEPRAGRWTDISPVRPDPSKRDNFGYAGLALDPHQAGKLVVSTLDRWTMDDEIFRSTDGGATWSPLLAGSTWDHDSAPYTRALTPHWIGDVALDPFNPARLWFVTGYGLWQADTSATPHHWTFANAGLEETVITKLVSPPEGAPLVSAIADLGGFRHDDLTVSPPAGMHRPHHGSSPSLDFAAQQPTKLVRTHWGPTRGAVSRDGGVTWQDFASAPAGATTSGPGIIALSADGKRVGWLPKGSAPFYSTDDGASWQQSRTSFVSTKEFFPDQVVSDRVNPSKFYLYAYSSGQVLMSIDGGESFASAAKLPPKGGLLQAEPGREGQLWLPAPNGLYLSADSGRSFQPMSGVDAAFELGFGRAAPGRDRSAIYLDGVVRGQRGLFRSDDSGATWIAISDARLRFGYIRTITGDPRIFGRVYVGTSGRGIFYGEPTSMNR